MESNDPFALLKRPEHRIIVRELVDSEEPVTIETLGAALATRLGDYDERSARIRLHHIDLPKLADAGVLEYEAQTGDVVRRDYADELKNHLLVADEATPTKAV